MATPSHVHSLICSAKRLKISPPRTLASPQIRSAALSTHHPTSRTYAPDDGAAALEHNTLPPSTQQQLHQLRLPRAVQATYLAPLRREAKHGIKACDLQLRSYSLSNLEVFADFCMRAAYYLNLPAKGPVPLPRITERWTVPKSNFVHKKSQENFERRTVRRLIQIQDGHPQTVAIWLAYIQKHQYFGVGLKANVFEHSGLEVAADMDAEGERIKERLGERFELFGRRKDLAPKEAEIERMLHSEPFKGAWGAYAPSAGAQSVPNANRRVQTVRLGDAGEGERES